ncbi:2-5A-dependent ribonuclease isoform X2 [Elgaria multicarinata webbii]|uniref:2-5A-dependent ribonuclease isoform X2 n=1 Tax=Elgaria multicarinata webbii TaxID=159646 RepID=UPI002FCD58A1
MGKNLTKTKKPPNNQSVEEMGQGQRKAMEPPGELQSAGSENAEDTSELNNAVRFGSIETVKQLLEKGVDINSKVEGGWTALHSAVKANKEEMVHLLLGKGADPYARKVNGATPFIIAGITGNVELLDLFLKKGSEIDEYDINGFTAFMEAALYGNEKALRFLYKKGADVNLGRVVDEGRRALNKGGATALMDAAKHGRVTVVNALVTEMKADVSICDNQGRNALVHALSVIEEKDRDQGKEEVALFLLKHKTDANNRDENGKTTLILAVERESQDLVKAILKTDEVDIDDADKNSRTALMVAVEKKNYEIAKILCEKGARTDIGDLIKIASVTYNNEKMLELLRKYRAPPRPSQPAIQMAFSSRRWRSQLQDLHEMYRPMIGKLKLFMYQDFRIQRTSNGGGVYLGIYDGKEVAVKIFHTNAENAEREKACLEECRTSHHLMKFYGWEERKACLYLCLALCEKNLEEYFGMAEDAAMESKDMLERIFLAVKELHGFGFGHQDLHPSNILIDVTGKVFLADFDKSTELVDDNDEKDLIIKEDLKALERLVVYVAMRGTARFEDLPTECPINVDNHIEIEDLRASLSNLDEKIPVSEQLGHLIYHPYFWSKQAKYRFLRDVGNESDIKTRGTKHQNDNSDILKTLNREDDPFKDWTEKMSKTKSERDHH